VERRADKGKAEHRILETEYSKEKANRKPGQGVGNQDSGESGGKPQWNIECPMPKCDFVT